MVIILCYPLVGFGETSRFVCVVVAYTMMCAMHSEMCYGNEVWQFVCMCVAHATVCV